MEDKAKRSPGGKLALWAFYAFCGYFLWAMARYWWVVGKIESVPGATIDGELGSTAGKWIGALLGFLVLGIVGTLLGRSPGTRVLIRRCMNITIKIAMLVAGLISKERAWTFITGSNDLKPG
jgi:hypothetical protein